MLTAVRSMPAELDAFFADCRAGRLDAVLGRLERVGGVEVRSPEGWTPLIVASFHGHVNLALALLARGADVNAVNAKGTSVLMYAKSAAIRDGNYAIMDVLVEAGADIDHEDSFGKNITVYADQLRADRLVRYLRAKRPPHPPAPESLN